MLNHHIFLLLSMSSSDISIFFLSALYFLFSSFDISFCTNTLAFFSLIQSIFNVLI
ncbi:uncharacterized protein BO97DRAFT_131422 [Aspergillus homomorphus CBS 101889]|uniref:Uncharacterized protein n=1 Tax=Aspergillus homomorphus (strain CBS 101889) TaxID=1450537 RepID=A0A395IB37_ASPHC|nr:hypothetical protein BO97DRAFT_131422 [Aspergillus homomorphus CBS 101889]RAL16343.1 hypothetical protein BO97DRAFT_131422 [Aspergillus homomorphus CBS 101889]